MNKKELAKRFNISLATLYNWEKTKPELIKLVKLGLEIESGIPHEKQIETHQSCQKDENDKDQRIKQLQNVIETLRSVIDTYQEIINKQK